MDLVSIDCPKCGASLPPRLASGQTRCEYCGARFTTRRAQPASTTGGPSPSTGSTALVLAVVAALLLVGLSGGVAFLVIVGGGQGEDEVSSAAAPRAPSERLIWDDVGGLPVLVRIGGQPAFVGRTRAVGADDQLFVEAYGARDAERLWRVGPLGSYSEGYRSTLFGAVDDRVVVSDYRSILRLVDLETGEEVRAMTLTDRVDQLCAREGGARVWVHQVDERAHLLDVHTGEMTEAPRPEWCPRSQREARRLAQEGVGVDRAPGVRRMMVQRVHVDAERGVALAVEYPGTPIPHAVGFDLDNGEILWTRILPVVDVATVRTGDAPSGLAGGRLVAAYGAGRDAWHLTALDARAGTRLWDVELRPLFAVDKLEGLVVGDSHALLARTSSLEVYDAATGTLLGTVGTESYE